MTAEEVARMLAGRLDGGVQHLRRLSGGASKQTWAFELSTGGHTRPLICQIERPGGHMGTGILTEAALLGQARATGVPVPAVVATSGNGPPPAGEVAPGDGSPGLAASPGWMVVEHVGGETIPRKLLRDPEYAEARGRLTAQCGRALAAIHAIPPDAVPGLDDTDQLSSFAGLLASMDEPRPVVELALRRLAATRPEPEGSSPAGGARRTVVHGDFRTGNLLVDPTGLRAVLDWELAHIGDPLEDLGWFCVRAWRFGSPHRAGGFGAVTDLVAAYEQASGLTVDPAAVSWWEAVGTLKWAVMCMIQAVTHRSGLSRSVELATIGRRVCENEWDLLGLLGVERPAGDLNDPDTPAPASTAPFGYPSSSALVEAVREFLEADVAETAASGRVRFHTRVSANALRMVERELVLGPGITAAHRARLTKLGFSDDRQLATTIRAGQCDERWDELGTTLAASVRDQLLVANPGYVEPDQPA